MKLYHPHTFEKLGLDVLLRRVKGFVHSEEALDFFNQLQPGDQARHLLPELQSTEEFRQLIQFDSPFPNERFPTLSPLIAKLRIEGNWLSREELWIMSGFLATVQRVRDYFRTKAELYPRLSELVKEAQFAPELAAELKRIFDDRGQIMDDASPELKKIRQDLVKAGGELRNVLYKVLRKAQDNNWSLEKEITVRNDRLVIPVKAEAKNQIAGFVQDISQTGGTVYIEPAEALALNNALRELQIREHNEIIRILQVLSRRIAKDLPAIEVCRRIMLRVEILRAKARLAVELDAILPEIRPEDKWLEIRQGRSPLLILKSKQEPLTIIPLDLTLKQKNRILLVSGPNAGGKSVALKTVGLLSLMLQCGFLVPVAEGSVFPLFDSFFLDIGDEQSIDSDLSTYTSRLFQWRQMGDKMGDKSLFLVDEFGSGTDPKQGGAIAEAFLERFVRVGALGIITTHYGNLKDMAEITPGLLNGAMQFDMEELKPTYRLIEGMPGRSFAFEMAKRVGVHSSILSKARKKMGTDDLDTEKLLRELERKQAALAKLVRENELREQRLKELVEKNERLEAELSQNKKQIIREAKEKARSIIDQANKDIERTIREIREKQADKEATRKAREKLRASRPDPGQEPEPAKVPAVVQEAEPARQPLKLELGTWARLQDSETRGEIVEIQGNRVVIAADALRLTVPMATIELIEAPKERKSNRIKVVGGRINREVKLDLDVMGQRVEEAIPAVDRFIDDARIAGLFQVRILHGKGTGALRDAIRSHIRDHHSIKELADAPVEMGGAGWTVVTLQ